MEELEIINIKTSNENNPSHCIVASTAPL